VFLVTAGRLVTPAVDRAGIAGVMRRVVLKLSRDTGIPVRETDVAPADVTQADELFITNALSGIRPVHSLGPRRWATGPVTRQLQRLLVHAGVGECAG
jgi:4-amino-4-deoxychorismate lyase